MIQPPLPTDNLYKFVALAGVVICGLIAVAVGCRYFGLDRRPEASRSGRGVAVRREPHRRWPDSASAGSCGRGDLEAMIRKGPLAPDQQTPTANPWAISFVWCRFRRTSERAEP